MHRALVEISIIRGDVQLPVVGNNCHDQGKHGGMLASVMGKKRPHVRRHLSFIQKANLLWYNKQ